MGKCIRLTSLFLMAGLAAAAAQQIDVETYHMPPKEIVDLVDAASIPVASVSPDEQWMVLEEAPPLLTIADLSQPELKLAGIRFNPDRHDQPRASYFRKLNLLHVADGRQVAVTGLPDSPRARFVTWSPDSQRIAFALSMGEGVELWVSDLSGVARRLSGLTLNGAMPGRPFHWLAGSQSIVARVVPEKRASTPEASRIPGGPVVQETTGRKAAGRTYEDMLKTPADAELFEYNMQAAVVRIGLDGSVLPVVPALMVLDAVPSPDGKYVLVESIHRPFSYLVPFFRFPWKIEVWSITGQRIREVADLPLAEEVPTDFDAVRTGPRETGWRADKPSSLFWAEAQDRGNPRMDTPLRDRLYTLAAPFDGQPAVLASLPMRFSSIEWGNDDLALVTTERWRDRKTQTIRIRPSAPAAPSQVVFDRSSEDRYTDPGRPALRETPYGTEVLKTTANGASMFLLGEGASTEGDQPFVDMLDLTTLKTTRLWRSAAPAYEVPLRILDDRGNAVLTRRETVSDPPDYVVRDVRRGSTRALTHNPNSMPGLASATKEIIHYKRADGLDLSGTLYLPGGYDAKRDGALPVLMWAYPQEFKSARAAGQVSGSPYRFTRPSWASPLFFLVRGYAVLDNPAIPILGEGASEPNDTYVDQLVAGAKAAVDDLVRRGVGDRDRMAIGGHSYGAFMTANLLAHSDLFRAGIARSGAYNRTLTPFSFQAEERSFWEATDTYMKMSPFTYANKINEPLLMIHGIDDDNTGTFPIQSERLYQAIKGLGGTARLVMLPCEAHSYRARESVMDMLWEMDRWLDKYVKNAPKR
jgi:dipeptidyl aminopeptidase/acylaminoacyl peptidase